MENNEFKILTGNTLTLTSNYQHYDLNINNVKTIEDVKLILKHMKLSFSPPSKEAYEEIKHLLIIN